MAEASALTRQSGCRHFSDRYNSRMSFLDDINIDIDMIAVEEYEKANHLAEITTGSPKYIRLARRCRYIVCQRNAPATHKTILRPSYWVGQFWKGSGRKHSGKVGKAPSPDEVSKSMKKVAQMLARFDPLPDSD